MAARARAGANQSAARGRRGATDVACPGGFVRDEAGRCLLGISRSRSGARSIRNVNELYAKLNELSIKTIIVRDGSVAVNPYTFLADKEPHSDY